MTIAERVRQLLAAQPPDVVAVTVTVAGLAAWLAEDGGATEGHDLTTAGVAAACDVSENTVRRWLLEGRLRGYRLCGGRDWRVTPAALAEFRAGPSAPPTAVTLDAWRRVRRPS